MIVPLIFLFSFILVFRTGSRGLLNVGDSLFPFFPTQQFRQFLYLWDSHSILGRDASATVVQLPWYGLATLLEKLGTSLWLINRLWFVLPFFLLGLSMYSLSGAIFGEGKKVPRFLATLFFMFNPFALNLLASGSIILALSFTAGVFVFGLFVRGLAPHLLAYEKVRGALLIGLASIFMPANLIVWVMMLLLCVAYFFFFLLVNRHNRPRLRHAVLYSSFFILYSSLVNSWWLLPFVSQILHPGYFQTLFAAGTDVSTLEFSSQFTSLFDVSRLFYGMTPTANFPISNYYHYLLSPTMTAVLVVLIFSVALFKKKAKFEIFFLVLAVFSVILASGTRPPFGFLYQFLWDHLPYFHIFRTTNRFNLYTMISYAVLIGFFYQRCKERVEKGFFFKFFIAAFLLISIFLSSWPLLSGDLYGQLRPHQIPQDYYDLREFLRNQEGGFRVTSLPMKDWLTPYSWSAPFDMQEILVDFSPKDVVVNPLGYLQDLKDREVSIDDPVYAVVYKHPGSEEALEALRQMGVRYLVVHHDYVVVWGNYYPVDVSELTKTLQESNGIKFVKAFGDLDVYEVEEFSPKVRTTLGKVSYVRVSPVEYQVNIEDTTEPFTLVLAENFHPGWRSSVGNHIKFGEFANGWEISPEDYKGGEVVLKYEPQRLFDIGLLVSVLSLMGGLLYYVVAKFTSPQKDDT